MSSASNIINKYSSATVEQVGAEPPGVIASEIVVLSSHLWEAGSLALKAEQLYSAKWMELRETLKTDGQADKRAKCTEEYGALQKARMAEKSVLETIRALKKLLQSKQMEMQNISGSY